MTSPTGAPPVLQGAQEPRILWVPEHVSSAGQEAIELARLAGLELDPWQELVLGHSLAERAGGLWAAMQVGLCVPRQNGKGTIEEGRELAGLFLLDEDLIIHTAHLFKTALEAFRRLLILIESTPDLDRRVKRVSRAHGEEGIELKGGQRIQFATRTLSAGRGLSGDCVIFDEAMYISEATINASLSVMSARPNPQAWYAGSAVDEEIHDHGLVFARVRDAALAGDAERLLYAEWSLPYDDPSAVPTGVAADPENWALTNPGLGRRITTDFIEQVELSSLSARGFAVERLGVGAWPDTNETGESKISADAWKACADPGSTFEDPVIFVFDVAPNRSAAAIGAAGWRTDGRAHIEVIDAREGTGWVADRLAELVAKHGTSAVLYAKRAPAESLVTEINEALDTADVDVEVKPVDSNEHAQACGMLLDAVEQGKVKHLGTTELAQAIKGASSRPLGEAWTWARTASSVNIAPLVAVTLALWGLKTVPRDEDPPFDIANYRIKPL